MCVLLALLGENLGKPGEVASVNVAMSQVVLLHNGHEREGVGDVGDGPLVARSHQHVEKLLSRLLRHFLVINAEVDLSVYVSEFVYLLDKEGKNVRGDVTVRLEVLLRVQIDKIEQDAEEVHRLVDII